MCKILETQLYRITVTHEKMSQYHHKEMLLFCVFSYSFEERL